MDRDRLGKVRHSHHAQKIDRSSAREEGAEQDFRAFEVLNLGRYERQSISTWAGVSRHRRRRKPLHRRRPSSASLFCEPTRPAPLGLTKAGKRRMAFHGARNGRLVAIGPINLPVGRLFVEEVITECRKRGASASTCLRSSSRWVCSLPCSKRRERGIDLAPKYIPAEVFDKRAVDKGQVVFHDISFVEATPRYEKKAKLAVKIELTDFRCTTRRALPRPRLPP